MELFRMQGARSVLTWTPSSPTARPWGPSVKCADPKGWTGPVYATPGPGLFRGSAHPVVTHQRMDHDIDALSRRPLQIGAGRTHQRPLDLGAASNC
ncbi:MAG: hypothetical protein CM15mP18_4490 [Methanobacteriota archaeon]|nr:MAG: hypothetical protein CM15mP18_4490 [Euryarchaeota archaeon]